MKIVSFRIGLTCAELPPGIAEIYIGPQSRYYRDLDPPYAHVSIQWKIVLLFVD